MKNQKLIEAVADISYIAGCHQYYSGNSRIDISDFIAWAKEFEVINKNTNWDTDDYMLSIEKFTNKKLAQEIQNQLACGSCFQAYNSF